MQIKLFILLALVPLITAAAADVKSSKGAAARAAPASASAQSKSSDSAESLDIEAPIQEKSAAAAPAPASSAKNAAPKPAPQSQKSSAEKAAAAAEAAAASASAADAAAELDEVKRNHLYNQQSQYGPAPAYVSNYEKPSYSKPVYSPQPPAPPAYVKPNSYAKPSYSKPVYTAPVYEKPTYTPPAQPSYSKPVVNAYNEKPVYGAQPAYQPAPLYNQQPQQYGNDYHDTLLQTNVIFRLGDRTPFWLPRNDYYKEKDFPEGLNQLINVGKERLVNLGRQLRQRYQNLLNNIRLLQINTESASERVNIESALSVLAGLAPPTSSQVWSTYDALATKWQPIAVNSVEDARDWKLDTNTRCRTAEIVENVTIIEEAPELRHFLAANREVIRRLEVLTGEDLTTELSWIWIANVYDTYLVEAQIFGSKFYPPRWADPKTLAVLKQANELKFSVWGHDQAYLKLRGNPLINSIVENLVNAGNGNDSVRVSLYSTNDLNVAITEHILGIFSGGQPGYGSGVIIELHRGDGAYGHEPQVHVLKVDLVDSHNSYNNNNYHHQQQQHVISQVNLSKSPRFAKHCYGQPTCSLSNFAIALHDWVLGIDEVEKQCNN